MKNINLCRLTLIFSSFLFTHYSYSINVSSDLSFSKCAVSSKAEKTYSKSNSDIIPIDLKNEYVTECYSNAPRSSNLYGNISISDVTTGSVNPIDPDWRKLIAHFY